MDNRSVPQSPWEQRIARAEVLTRQYPFASEILAFYLQVARFQQELYGTMEESLPPADPAKELPPALAADFLAFLTLVEKQGPARLGETARHLRNLDAKPLLDILNTCWSKAELSPSQPLEFLARAFLQPRAVATRIRSGVRWDGYTHATCPFCGRKPGAGVLRPMGDGGQRSLFCSFCLAEWEFRRIICAGCGETDHHKLPVYRADDFDYIRVECCDTCKQYLKTVDLTKNGLADPVVDEITAAPLDLWAREQGYSKLELNLVGM
jgi:FdhE protein